jgi:hypothetical protein
MSWRDFHTDILSEKEVNADLSTKQQRWIHATLAFIMALVVIAFFNENPSLDNVIYPLLIITVCGLPFAAYFMKDPRKKIGQFKIAADTISIIWISEDLPHLEFKIFDILEISVKIDFGASKFTIRGYNCLIIDKNGKHKFYLAYPDLQQIENFVYNIEQWQKQGYNATLGL